MPTGPKTGTSRARKGAASLALRVRETETLLQAWHAIEQNGRVSRSSETREQVKQFRADLPRQLRNLQRRLRDAPYIFAKQRGLLIPKDKGNPAKGVRPLVIAPLPDRIVQRAILDVLQNAKELSGVQAVLATPTSFGGIAGRGVDDAIRMIEQKRKLGEANFVAGSDISAFFTAINKPSVVSFLRGETDDEAFVDLFERAMNVELDNVGSLGPEAYEMFPSVEFGVAQGCPLSAFAGNVALREFDHTMNGSGVTCIRYIDDFILLSAKQSKVMKALESAGAKLAAMGMNIYKPDDGSGKAFSGPFGENIEFLGYRLQDGLYPPSEKNLRRLINGIRDQIKLGEDHINRALKVPGLGQPLQLYGQTLVEVDRRLRAWSGTFKEFKCRATAQRIDDEINQIISSFIRFYSRRHQQAASRTEMRRILGIHVIADDVNRRNAVSALPADGAGRDDTATKPSVKAKKPAKRP